uniref:CBFD_NFYB_HMF domain-containing protein n=1 Tax=Rhabditophanes sp. KR3021 TaxID=114890 RepID=A0AC35TRT0_9BILA
MEVPVKKQRNENVVPSTLSTNNNDSFEESTCTNTDTRSNASSNLLNPELSFIERSKAFEKIRPTKEGLFIPKASFKRVVKDAARSVSTQDHYFSADAMEVIQYSAEEFISIRFKQALKATHLRQAATVKIQDFVAVTQILQISGVKL